MKRPRIRFDFVLSTIMMVFLFVPFIQQWGGLVKVKPLKGVFEPAPKPSLTFGNYRSGNYQTQMEQYVSENFGLREPVIRLYNQYVWSAYNKTYSNFIVPGKNGYLYYAEAVNEHFGVELRKHYKSNEEAMSNADIELRLMNKLRHVLKSYGIEFVAFIAPDKPEVYPEYLPRRDADTTFIHQADYFSHRMDETGFPCINMTDWYVNMRDTASFPLFPKTDSHWRYSAIYGYDSLFRFINTLEGEAKFPTIHIGAPMAYESDEMEGDEETLNLLFRIAGDKTRYKSDITVIDDTLHRKPKVLFVGDSFIWSMKDFMPIRQIMADMEVWFYNSTAYVGFDNKKVSVSDLDRLSHILNADYVVFYSAGHQWWHATFGFAKDALLQLCVSDSLFDASVADYTNRLRHTEGYDDLTEEELHDNIAWMLRNNPELIPGLGGDEMPSIRNVDGIAKAMAFNQINADQDWLSFLKIYATQSSISIDDALRKEAERMVHGETLLRDEAILDTTTFIMMKKQEIIEKWRNDPDQMQAMQQKANDKGYSIDEMLERDAQWVINWKIEHGELFK